MSWILAIAFGTVALALLFAWRRARRELARAAVEKEELVEGRKRLVAAMRQMTAALAEPLSDQELQRRIVHAAAIGTGAASACLFLHSERETLRGEATVGLFPPLRAWGEETKAQLATRAKLIARALQPAEIPMGEGLVGRVAQSGRGELVREATVAPGLARHDDPALQPRSLIAVPLGWGEQRCGVLVAANPEDKRRFDEHDFAALQALAEQAARAFDEAEARRLRQEQR